MQDGEWMKNEWNPKQFPERRYPNIAYVETTNICNANCLSCLNDRCKRTRGIMKPVTFRKIVRKLKKRGIKIGAMFCFGEPLIDDTLFEKYKFGMENDIFVQGHVGLNTNVSLLTKEKFDDILNCTPNIILSFFHVGNEYERLTGGLSWESSYQNAKDFIEYRDKNKPEYPIFISCNAIKGANMDAVKRVFKGYNVSFVRDAELRWSGSVITGVIDRCIMFNHWRCDGHKGALQIKWNGDCEFCAYDIIGSPEGGETKFANILTDSWEEIERKFKEKWVSKCSLCARCDYWHRFKRVKDANFVKIKTKDWYDWQKPFLKEGEDFID